ncbi:MAG: type II secretion system F family protein [Oscillospiraceae bacterium]|jgi:type IV pilus assembly protein PilC|nr:type II secretion system F family protein [Oscillospiraceae bacterium]
MALFSYQATDLTGKVRKGTEVAESNQQLVEILRGRDLFVTRSEVVKEKEQTLKYKFKTAKLSIFCRQLSAMLYSGINLVRALHILMTQEENKKAREVLRDIYEELQRGRSFTETLEMKEGVFPELFVGMMAAGESSGNLDMIVDRVADHYAKENKLKNVVKKSLTYPIILGVLMVIIVIALFTFILPMFITMYPEGEELPGLSGQMMAFSDFLTSRWYIILVIILVLALIIRAVMRVSGVRLALDKFKVSMPKVGKLVKIIYTARFGRTMANLFASGMQMVECIEKSVGTLNNRYLLVLFEDVLNDIKRGEPLSAAIAKINIFDGMFTSTIYIGEESGRLDEILSKSADFYDEEADTALQKLTTMIEPIMIIFMGGIVALVLATIFPLMYGSFENVA